MRSQRFLWWLIARPARGRGSLVMEKPVFGNRCANATARAAPSPGARLGGTTWPESAISSVAAHQGISSPGPMPRALKTDWAVGFPRKHGCFRVPHGFRLVFGRAFQFFSLRENKERPPCGANRAFRIAISLGDILPGWSSIIFRVLITIENGFSPVLWRRRGAIEEDDLVFIRK
jgi:hypothetical protein